MLFLFQYQKKLVAGNCQRQLNAPDDPVRITLNEIQKGLRFLLLKVTTSRQIDVLSKDPPRTSKKSRGNYSAEAAVCIAEALRKLRRRLSNLSIAEADAYLALHRSLNLRVKMKANVCLFVYSHRLACQIFSRNKMIGESKSVKFARGKARLLRPFWSQTVGLTEALLPSFKLCLGAVSILYGGLILYESNWWNKPFASTWRDICRCIMQAKLRLGYRWPASDLIDSYGHVALNNATSGQCLPRLDYRVSAYSSLYTLSNVWILCRRIPSKKIRCMNLAGIFLPHVRDLPA